MKRKVPVFLLVFLIISCILIAGCISQPEETSSPSEETLPYADKFIELHAHLDGSITPDIAIKLTKLKNTSLTQEDNRKLIRDFSYPGTYRNLDEFLKCFNRPLSLLQTKEEISEGVYLVLEDMKANGVIYAELRFAPQFHTRKGLTQEEAVLAALEGQHRSTLKSNLILCLMRGEENTAENLETIEVAKKYLVEDNGVTAIDLAGAEARYATKDFKQFFELAKMYGIPFTIHAGEAAGAESVRQAVELGAARIGHGVRIFEDESVVQLVKDKGITLEMCPTSNRLTHAVEDMSKYPLMQYLENGLKVTINTDDLAIVKTTLAGEFRYMEKNFGLTAEQERTLLQNAVDAAFTTDEVKEELRIELGL